MRVSSARRILYMAFCISLQNKYYYEAAVRPFQICDILASLHYYMKIPASLSSFLNALFIADAAAPILRDSPPPAAYFATSHAVGVIGWSLPLIIAPSSRMSSFHRT